MTSHLRLLLGQRAVLKRRSCCTTCCELFVPVLVLFVLVLVSKAISVEHKKANNYSVIPTFDARNQTIDLALPAARLNYMKPRSDGEPFVLSDPSLALPFACKEHKVALFPEGPEVSAFLQWSSNLTWFAPCLNTPATFPTEDDAVSWMREKGAGVLVAVVKIDTMDPTTHTYEYTIRVNDTFVPRSNTVIDTLVVGRSTNYKKYATSGFTAILQLMDTYILCLENGAGPCDVEAMQAKLSAAQLPFPVQDYEQNPFFDAASGFIALIFALAFIFPFSKIVKGIVEEKELRLKEGMLMMGLDPTAYTLSWLITTTVTQLIGSVLATIVMRAMLSKANLLLVFVLIYLFNLSSIGVCFFLGSLFSKSRTASLFSVMYLFVNVLPILVLPSDLSNGVKGILGLLPAMSFGYAIQQVTGMEGASRGASWSDVWEGDYPIGLSIVLMVIDLFLYHFLAWYCGHVVPGEFGVPKKPWFLFTRSFWCGGGAERPTSNHNNSSGHQLGGSLHRPLSVHANPSLPGEAFFEQVLPAQGLEGKVHISGLRRVFDKKAVAVQSLDLTMYEGQITVLLGHNGAGKTTTINMLTGMLPVTSGDAQIYGHSILTGMPQIRKVCGVCPQHNILWPNLTVSEHLAFFAKLKGLGRQQSGDQQQAEVDRAVKQMLQGTQLEDKAQTYSSALSGGMKRRLSVGIALIADSRIVFLDEPTAGMDPEAREHTHALLSANTQGRVIVLTTHFMDEADKLGDRIAIMSKGALKCCGSPLFLKSRLGVGYNLTVALRSRESSAEVAPQVAEMVQRHVPSAVVQPVTGMELPFLLPMDSVGRFASLFRELEDRTDALQIDTFGISMTKLEDVFMKIALEGEDDADEEAAAAEAEGNGTRSVMDESSKLPSASASVVVSKQGSEPTTPVQSHKGSSEAPTDSNAVQLQPNQSEGYPPAGAQSPAAMGELFVANLDDYQLATGSRLFAGQFRALLVKRFHCAKRDRKFMFCLVFLPVLVIIAALSLTYIAVQNKDLVLTPLMFYSKSKLPGEVFVAGTPGAAALRWPADEYGANALTVLNATQAYGVNTSLGLTGVLFDEYDRHAKRNRYGGAVFNDVLAHVCCYRDPLGQVYDPAGPYRFPLRMDTVLHNSTGPHALPVFYAELNKARMRAITGQPSLNRTARAHPMPRSARDQARLDSFKLVGAAIIILFPFTFIPANFAAFLVKERSCKAKHVQLVSGVSVLAYWLSSFAWDVLLYTATVLCSVLTFAAFGKTEYVGDAEKVVGTVLLFMLYGMASTALAYLCQFPFQNHSAAQNVLMMANLVFGVFLVIASRIMASIDSTEAANNALKYAYRVVPSYCLGEGLLQLSLKPLFDLIDEEPKGVFDADILGAPLAYLAVEIPLFFLLTLLCDWPRLRNLRLPGCGRGEGGGNALAPLDTVSTGIPEHEEEDEDVAAERQDVEAGDGRPDDLVTVQGLRKVYAAAGNAPPKVAVEDLSFGVKQGEIFALLGTNGAGKTTTLSILSGEFPMTSGRATLNGHDIALDLRAAQRNLGYCPQFDALLDLMTVEEHLQLYARLRGMPAANIPHAVESVLHHLGLADHRAKRSMKLSGGNKRKLSMGIAIIGGPKVVFLDEPSAGMDPVARHQMCQSILGVAQGRSVILTTHHLEEVEALANRVGIMVSGRFRCLGTLQRLKHKFGEGYWLEFRVGDERHKGAVCDFVGARFGAFSVEEEQPSFLRLKLTSPDLKLSAVFESIEQERQRLGVRDYSVSQPNLEQVFLRISADNNPQNHH